MTTTTPKIVTTNEALNLYAKHYEDNSFCIDVSGNQQRLFHLHTKRGSCIDAIRNGFSKFAKTAGIQVEKEKYKAFLQTLPVMMCQKLPNMSGYTFKPVDSKSRFITEHGLTLGNLYQPPNHTAPANPDFSVLEEYFRRILPNDIERKTVVQWLAAMVLEPLVRPQWCVLIRGVGQCGKSRLSQLMQLALGANCVEDNKPYSAFLDEFAELFPNNLFAVFDDKVMTAHQYTTLKTALISPRLTVGIKGGQATFIRECYCRTLVLSNFKDSQSIPFDNNERRFYVPAYIEGIDSQETLAWFNDIYRPFVAHPDAGAVIHAYLSQVDMTGYQSGYCEKTEHLEAIITGETTKLTEDISHFINDLTNPYFLRGQLMEHLSSIGHKNLNIEKLAKELQVLGWIEKRVKLNQPENQKQTPVWKKISDTKHMSEDVKESLRGISEKF